MATERIFCGICGHSTESALFGHLREAHGISAEDYRRKCPNAPLFTAAFKAFVEEQGVHVEDGASTGALVAGGVNTGSGGEVRVTRELFGVAFSCAVKPAAGAPAVDPGYHFDEEQARAILHSLSGAEPGRNILGCGGFRSGREPGKIRSRRLVEKPATAPRRIFGVV